MSISPVVMNGAINATQDISAIKAHADGHASVLQSTTQEKIEHQAERKLNTVREQDDVENRNKGFDAKEKGSNEYSGDGGAKRRHNPDGEVHIKGKGGFDVSI